MSWIRSESNLPRHPKTLALKGMLNIEMDALIGRLHFLWWWCLDYAIDGDLSKKEAKVIEDACQIPLKYLIRAGFIDSRPYRRIHSWYEIQGNYLRARFKDTPEKWQRIKQLYENDEPMSLQRLSRMGNNPSKESRTPTDVQNRTERTDVRNVRTDGETTKDARATLDASRASENGKIKSFEEAGDDEICAPPKDLLKMIGKKVPPATTD